MESLAYTYLALAHEEPSSLELSNVEIFDLLTKLSLLSLLKQEKFICKAWLYGLSLSLIVMPFSDALALHQAERREQAKNLASNPNSETMLASAKYSSLNMNEEIESASISSPKNNEHQKVLFVKGNNQKVNPTNLLDTSPSIQAISTIQTVGETYNQVPVSNPIYEAEPKQVFSTVLAMLESPSNSNTEPEFEATTEPEQKGKLRIVNDTPYIGIVALYKPGRKYPYRYAHIPACHKRELLATYSNHWQVNFNNGDISSVSKVSTKDGNFFEIKTSKLTGEESWVNSCEEALKSLPVNSLKRNKPQEYYNQYYDLMKLKSSNQINDQAFYPKLTFLMQGLINEQMRFVEYFYADQNQVAFYCVLENFLKEINSIYQSLPNTGLILDGKGDMAEVKKLKELNNIFKSNNKLPIFSGRNLDDNDFTDLIGYVENYLLTRNKFYNFLGQAKIVVVNNSRNKFQPTSTTTNFQVKDINSECKVRVESGYQQVRIESGHQIVSEPSKKAKNC